MYIGFAVTCFCLIIWGVFIAVDESFMKGTPGFVGFWFFRAKGESR